MKLLLRRDQRSGLTGKIIFVLDVRASLSDEQKSAIKKYKLSETRLYEKHEVSGPGSPLAYLGVMGAVTLAGRLAARAMNITVAVKDLEHGRRIECKDILEMLAVEEQIKEAAANFKAILDAASSFGGEEAIEL